MKNSFVSVARLLIPGAAIVWCGFALSAGDEESKSKDELPAPVKKALQGVEPREIESEEEDGNTVYEVELAVAGGEVELKLSAEGKLLAVEVDGAGGVKPAGADEEREEKNEGDDKKPEAKETEREVQEAEVPAAALKTLKEQAGGAKIVEFAEEVEHGHKFYEGSWKSPSGSNVDVLVTEAGALVETEEAIGADKAPETAIAAARKAAGEKAELRCEKKTAVMYEFKFRKDGKRYELLLTPDGRKVEEEVETGEPEKGDE
jgi:uncharacterized membrane protein YkoI